MPFVKRGCRDLSWEPDLGLGVNEPGHSLSPVYFIIICIIYGHGPLHRPGGAVPPVRQEAGRGGDPWAASSLLREGWEKGGIGGVILLNL